MKVLQASIVILISGVLYNTVLGQGSAREPTPTLGSTSPLPTKTKAAVTTETPITTSEPTTSSPSTDNNAGTDNSVTPPPGGMNLPPLFTLPANAPTLQPAVKVDAVKQWTPPSDYSTVLPWESRNIPIIAGMVAPLFFMLYKIGLYLFFSYTYDSLLRREQYTVFDGEDEAKEFFDTDERINMQIMDMEQNQQSNYTPSGGNSGPYQLKAGSFDISTHSGSGSQNGSYHEGSHKGGSYNDGSHKGSQNGSYHGGSKNGSHQGSVSGSHHGSVSGSHHGSISGSHHGSLTGSHHSQSSRRGTQERGQNGNGVPQIWCEEHLVSWQLNFNALSFQNALIPPSKTTCSVYMGTFQQPDHTIPVALKWFPPKNSGSNQQDIKQIWLKDELDRFATFQHPQVVQFIGISWSIDTNIIVVTEYMPRGNVRQWLQFQNQRQARAQPNRELDTRWHRVKLNIARDVAQVLLFLHTREQPVAHGNCNTRNVLLNDQGKAKMSDFGRSTTGAPQAVTHGAPSGRWISPEALLAETPPSVQSNITHSNLPSDIYAFGILLTELDTHAMAFCDLLKSDGSPVPEWEVLNYVAKGALTPTLSRTCPKALYDLIHQCTRYNPAERPPIRHIVQVLDELAQEMQ